MASRLNLPLTFVLFPPLRSFEDWYTYIDSTDLAPLVGVEDETYLRGTQVFLEAETHTVVRGQGLQNAAFWFGFRQEFHRAFIKQRAFRFDLSCWRYLKYKTLEAADDFTWANRVILHCAGARFAVLLPTVMILGPTASGGSIITNGTIVSHQISTQYFNVPDRSKSEVSLRYGILESVDVYKPIYPGYYRSLRKTSLVPLQSLPSSTGTWLEFYFLPLTLLRLV